MIGKILSGASIASLTLAALVVAPVQAATTVVVTPTNTQGWSTADTRPGGAVNYVADVSSPGGDAALQLTTDSTNEAKSQYIHESNTPLASVTDLSYYTKQNSASFVGGDPSYQLLVDLNGAAAGGFTTLVYEPYQGGGGAVVPGIWQQWDVDAGNMWSSRNFSEGTCVLTAGAGGPPYYTIAGLQATCPSAVVVGFGVNVGTYNPSYDVETDLVVFNDTTYDFELVEPIVVNEPSSKDACKKDGWMNLTNAEGAAFKNQGQCVAYSNHQ